MNLLKRLPWPLPALISWALALLLRPGPQATDALAGATLPGGGARGKRSTGGRGASAPRPKKTI